jgi:hypothetical protein
MALPGYGVRLGVALCFEGEVDGDRIARWTEDVLPYSLAATVAAPPGDLGDFVTEAAAVRSRSLTISRRPR